MKSIIRSLTLIFLSFVSYNVYAQNVQVNASIDSTHLAIGQQTLIHYEVTQDKDQQVTFPAFKDTLVSGIEILKVLPKDTIRLNDSRITVKQDILVTSFDSALYYIPGAEFVAGVNMYKSNPLALKVITYDIADDSTEVVDIMGIKKPEFVIWDYLNIFYWILAVAAVCVLAYIAYKRWRRRVDNPEELDDTPKVPPYDQAISSLESLKEQKLWQQGFNKEYYTALTDILRRYLSDEYHINAMEMTSSEILYEIRSNENVKPVISNLKQILEVSDFVKFAKMTPLLDDNEMSMRDRKSVV